MKRSRFLNKLYEYTFFWLKEKIISKDEKNHLQFYLDKEKRNLNINTGDWIKNIVNLLYIMSITLIISGIIYFFASNWKGFDKFTKLAIVFSSMFVFYSAGLIIKFINKKLDFLYKLLLFAGTLLFGTAIALIGQIYHMPANSSRFFFIWFIPAIMLALFVDYSPYYVLSIILVNLSVWFYFFPDSQFWRNHYLDNILISFSILFLINFLPFMAKIFLKQVSKHSTSKLVEYISYVMMHLYLYWLSFKFVSEYFVLFANIIYLCILVWSFYYFSQKQYNMFMIYYSLVISIFYFLGKYIEIIFIFSDKYDIDTIFYFMLFGGVILIPCLYFLSRFILKITGSNNEK